MLHSTAGKCREIPPPLINFPGMQNGWYYEDGTDDASNTTGTYQLFNVIGAYKKEEKNTSLKTKFHNCEVAFLVEAQFCPGTKTFLPSNRVAMSSSSPPPFLLHSLAPSISLWGPLGLFFFPLLLSSFSCPFPAQFWLLLFSGRKKNGGLLSFPKVTPRGTTTISLCLASKPAGHAVEGKGWTRFYFLTPPAAMEKEG